MATSFTIPTYFTAVDKFSAPVNGMVSSMENFTSKTELAAARSERAFRKVAPIFGEASRQMLSMVGAAALASAAIGAVVFSGKSVMDYETAIANLSAVTGTSGADLDKFKTQIKTVATATKESSIDVANAFTAIGNNQPQLLKDAEGMAAVTQASIILARASKMELAPAAEALTSIMNQYSVGAKDAARTTDMLAAAAQAGSMEITATAEALQKFAPIATVFGVKMNESLALIQTGSKFFKEGTESGTKFLNIMTTMASMKVQDPKALGDLQRLGVNMDIVTSKTLPFSDRLKELKKIGNDIPALFHVFGKENIAMAGSILNSTDAYDKLIGKIEETGKAQEMANKNNATLSRMIDQLKNKFVTWITTSDEAAKSLSIMKTVFGFLADNMSTIIKYTGIVVAGFTAWFVINKILAGWIWVTNAYTVAMLKLNVAMLANPIGVWLALIGILIGVLVLAISYFDEWGAALIFIGSVAAAFFAPFTAGFLFIIGIVQSFMRNWDMIKKAFTEDGFLAGIWAIGKALLDAVLFPIQQILQVISKLTGFEWAANAAKGLEKFRAEMGVNIGTAENPKYETVNPSAAKNDSMSAMIGGKIQNIMTIDFRNMPKGVEVSGDTGNANSAIPYIDSTMKIK